MISISSILIISILLITMFVMYNTVVVDTFDNNLFTVRLNVLKEYLRTVGDDVVVPSTIGYVTHVQHNKYVVTYFDTTTLKDMGVHVHDATREEFSFASQTYSNVFLREDAASVSFVANDDRKFMLHLDDDVYTMSCEDDEVFDGVQCAQKPICDKSDVNLPLTSDRLNRILFNDYSAQRKPVTDDSSKHHPTAYVKCDSTQTPQIEECLNGEMFNGTHCVYEPVLQTNGKGTVGYVNFEKITNFAISRTMDYNTINENELNGQNEESNKMTKKVGFKNCGNGKLYTKLVAVNTTGQEQYMVPVNYTHPFDVTPCLNHDVGYTFASLRVASSQYFECLDNNNLFLHTCNDNVTVRNGRYECDKEVDCMQFEDGTGVIINTVHNNNISFDTGKSVCNNYKIQEVVECDTGDFVVDKVFSHPLSVTFNVALPSHVFDPELDKCVDYSVDRVHVTKDTFTVDVPTYPSLKHSMIGRVSKISDKKHFQQSDNISEFVTYTRDVNEIAFDPINFTALDCTSTDGTSILVDLLDNTRYNICVHGVVDKEIILENDEFVDFNNQVQKLNGYTGQCRFDDSVNYFDQYHRIVDGYECYFTVPKIS
ncbi:P95 [Erinnyis ello granulovirus]|uniref:p95 n=1 Tax=Erinnyis ello granulovirus TaxID=307444 RepID=A0A097DAS2_9BBAC|nr:P95 [Erinnyis ello granulovirus]AIS92092.1 P95 [Erinnyis ello granulovirus]ARX71432.1 p95/vp91 [Erinnyis ello granulovirus]ARX71562.1 p95/vp91 [Erinnyis ello granulovirus]ARX71692.1 p95/vp91 [Erinnyis ello granulovirus]ARX71822.1 p95/vp91 [Erinnyis ello granulovirus]